MFFGAFIILILEQHHELKEVKKASKKTKMFETQKLVKKLKNLRSVNAFHLICATSHLQSRYFLRLKNGVPKEINDYESQLEELKVTFLPY